MKYKYTRLYRVNHKLVVADTLEEAIELYKSYSKKIISAPKDILAVKAVGDGQIPENFNALIKK